MYSDETKKSALGCVRSHLSTGKSRAAAFRLTADELGISISSLRRWDREIPSLPANPFEAPTQDDYSPCLLVGSLPDARLESKIFPVAATIPAGDESHTKLTGQVGDHSLKIPARESWWTRNRDAIAGQVVAGLVAGLIVTGAGTVLAAKFSTELAASQDIAQKKSAAAARILENTRFVREVVIDNQADRPFMDLDLRGASLGLKFQCATPQDYEPSLLVCLDLSRSDLSATTMTGANLTEGMIMNTKFVGAFMFNVNMDRVFAATADFSGAFVEKSTMNQSNFSGANFSGASLHTSDLRSSEFGCTFNECANLSSARLTGTDLRGTDFRHANLSGADLTDACFDLTTLWPADLTQVQIPSESNDRYCRHSSLSMETPWYGRSASYVSRIKDE